MMEAMVCRTKISPKFWGAQYMLMMKIAVESSLLKCEISKTSYRLIIDFLNLRNSFWWKFNEKINFVFPYVKITLMRMSI